MHTTKCRAHVGFPHYENTELPEQWHAQAGEVVFVVSTLVGLMLWGIGFWWLVHGVTCVAARFFFGGLKFNMGFWCAHAACILVADRACARASWHWANSPRRRVSTK